MDRRSLCDFVLEAAIEVVHHVERNRKNLMTPDRRMALLDPDQRRAK